MIDWDEIEANIIGAASIGLTVTTAKTTAKARKYAPVRSIFGRTRRGPAFTGTFRSQRDYDRWRRSMPKNRRIDLPAAEGSNKAGPRYGHNNSFTPVMRFTSGRGRITVTGDFRRYDKSGRQLSQHVATPHSYEKIGGGKAVRKAIDPNGFLSARGRAEARSGRASYQAPKAFTLGIENGKIVRTVTHREAVARLGGRLRGEIFATQPRLEGGRLVTYIISPVEYSAPQEYGSRHNRSHPFMRPALFEARRVLPAEVAKALRKLNDRVRAGSGMR